MTTLEPEIRRLIAWLAKHMIPPSDTMPGANQIDLAEAPLNLVLKYRPDLASRLCSLPAVHPGDDCKAYLRLLEARQPVLYQALLHAILGAYYMHPEVKRRLGYHGQQALTLPRGGFGGEELIEQLLSQPPRYRDPAGR
ncbi:MAG: hypothetical protein R3D57_07925 [Hyphomicrobiaceae bacterium]